MIFFFWLRIKLQLFQVIMMQKNILIINIIEYCINIFNLLI